MITCEPKTSLATDGYEVVPGIFTDEEIEAYRDAITESIDRTARALRAPFDLSDPAEPLDMRLEIVARHDRVYAMALYQAVLADTQRDERVAEIAEHPRLSNVIADAIRPYTPNGATIRVRADIPSIPAKRSIWHQDVVRPGPSGCASIRVACWIPLGDVDETTGALEVIPGRWDSLPHVPSMNEGRSCIDESVLLPDRSPVAVPVRRGDVLLMDRFLPHRGIPVANGRCRWAIAMWVRGMCASEE